MVRFPGRGRRGRRTTVASAGGAGSGVRAAPDARPPSRTFAGRAIVVNSAPPTLAGRCRPSTDGRGRAASTASSRMRPTRIPPCKKIAAPAKKVVTDRRPEPSIQVLGSENAKRPRGTMMPPVDRAATAHEPVGVSISLYKAGAGTRSGGGRNDDDHHQRPGRRVHLDRPRKHGPVGMARSRSAGWCRARHPAAGRARQACPRGTGRLDECRAPGDIA